jgi:hypothetical protein
MLERELARVQQRRPLGQVHGGDVTLPRAAVLEIGSHGGVQRGVPHEAQYPGGSEVEPLVDAQIRRFAETGEVTR